MLSEMLFKEVQRHVVLIAKRNLHFNLLARDEKLNELDTPTGAHAFRFSTAYIIWVMAAALKP